MGLKVFNTLSRSIEPFVPLNPAGKKVGIYCCGPTVHDFAHIGNFRTFVFADIVRRYLTFRGFDVRHVMNITDVEDKIIRRVNESGKSLAEFTGEFEQAFFADLEALGCQMPHDRPRATAFIGPIIRLIKKLESTDIAYKANDGSVYFSIDKYREAGNKYGQLLNINLDEMRPGERVSSDEYEKESIADFALWKARVPEDGEVFWDSPWGEGRPGWHIECSAMSLKHFGEQFDIHGGGHDLRFPHHEAEIFQSECCTGKEPLVQYWMHNGFVNIDGEKMSKSLGNFWTVREALENYDPLVLRHALLNAHYRSPIDLTEQLLEDAKGHHAKLVEAYGHALVIIEQAKKAGMQEAPRLPQADVASPDFLTSKLGLLEKLLQEAAIAMDDDFNSRQALAKVSNGARLIPQILNSEDIDERDTAAFAMYAIDWLEEFAGRVLGLLPAKDVAMAVHDPSLDPARQAIKDQVEQLLARRAIARAAKDWDSADEIRDALAEMGVSVKDTPDGVVWTLD